MYIDPSDVFREHNVSFRRNGILVEVLLHGVKLFTCNNLGEAVTIIGMIISKIMKLSSYLIFCCNDGGKLIFYYELHKFVDLTNFVNFSSFNIFIKSLDDLIKDLDRHLSKRSEDESLMDSRFLELDQ